MQMDREELPSISIIIPTYNEAENILELIHVIDNNLQNHFTYELIVVDDNSPDGTGEIVENYAINECRSYVKSAAEKSQLGGALLLAK
jgi:glycosyltransferase involved in cell wall biosynthesis